MKSFSSSRRLRAKPKKRISAVALLFAIAAPAFAQDPQVQELKERLKQLEQMVVELKDQVAALEKKQETTPLPPPPINEPAAYTQRRQTASQNEISAARIDNESIDPHRSGYITIPNTGTLFKPFGYIKTDFIYDLKYAGQSYGLYVPSLFPSTTQPPARSTTVSARPSRLALEFLQPFRGSDAKAYIELDFLGGFDRNSLRVRHVYGQWKNILAGQTWSLFADPDAFPDTLEFEGPPSILFARQAQIRYTHRLTKQQSIAMSVERTGPDLVSTSALGTPIATSDTPDLLFSHRYEGSFGHTQTTFLYRRVGGFIENSSDPRLSAQRNGYGVSFSTAFALGGGARSDSIVLQGVLGRGITNYYNDNTGLGLDIGVNAAGAVVAVPSGAITAGYTHHWNSLFRSSVTFGRLQINSAAESPETTYKVSDYISMNLIAQPRPSILFGGEFIYGWLERKNGFKYIAPRIQLSATYYFNKNR